MHVSSHLRIDTATEVEWNDSPYHSTFNANSRGRCSSPTKLRRNTNIGELTVPRPNVRKSLQPRIIGSGSLTPKRQFPQKAACASALSPIRTPKDSVERLDSKRRNAKYIAPLHLRKTGCLSTALGTPVMRKNWGYVSPYGGLFAQTPTPRGKGYKLWVNRISTPELPRRPTPPSGRRYRARASRNTATSDEDEEDDRSIQWSTDALDDAEVDKFINMWRTKTRKGHKGELKEAPAENLSYTWRVNNASAELDNSAGRRQKHAKYFSEFQNEVRGEHLQASRAQGSCKLPIVSPTKQYTWNNVASQHSGGIRRSKSRWEENELQTCIQQLDAFETGPLAKVIQDQIMVSGVPE